MSLPIRLLPRHTAIIAGSGSGKTVLLRRLVEEAALAGIPAIVIDPNNDLSRLGDSWPERPAAFTDADAAQAAAYAERVEVVVWTPGVNAGNPLFLSVLPDFSGIGADPDERQQAVEMAAETLGPLAGARKGLQRGVLADALRVFAERGGSLGDFITLLADLPDGVSDIGEAAKHAAKMADELRAAVATNPLLRVKGAVLDPKLLFFGADPARTRISVINLSGLGSEAAREDFVNRLQMTLFGWIKRNPSPRGMLYVVDEAQTFLPAQRRAPASAAASSWWRRGANTGSGSWWRRRCPRACTTRSSRTARPSSSAARAPRRRSRPPRRSWRPMAARLRYRPAGRGRVLLRHRGLGRPAKLTTPLCLSYHPANPPTPEQVVAAARRSAGA